MIPLLLMALVQQPAPTVSARTDRVSASVGQEITLTVDARGASVEPLEISFPPTDGFALVGRSEQSRVSVGPGPGRTATLVLRLRAVQAGTFALGPVTVRQGLASARAAAIPVTVTAGGPGVGPNPRLQALIARAGPPRRAGQPSLAILVSADTVYPGEQVDVLTAAWFPRDLRARLRRPPTLDPPAISGVWSYPQPAPNGIAASRLVGRTWYDLFVTHQVIFPLVAGEVAIQPATLRYSVPVTMQFFSQEQQYSLQSNSVIVTARPFPAAGRPADFSGAAGRNLTLARTAPTQAAAGSTVPVNVSVAGGGNVALWPAPPIAWPDSVRNYPDRSDEEISVTGGLVGGSKVFRFIAIPDSAGPLSLPALHYSYFDLGSRRYRTLTAPRVTVAVTGLPGGAPSRPTPPPLLADTAEALARTVAGGLPLPVWIVIALIPVAAWGGMLLRARRRPRRRVSDVAPQRDGADRRLLAALRAVVPDAADRTGGALVAALRAAGVEPALARRIAASRDDLLASRYGPRGGPRTEAAIAREMDQLTGALGGRMRHRDRRRRRLAALALVAVLPARAHATQDPASLYARGAFDSAARVFAGRAAARPDVAAWWYGLGAARYRLGSDAGAEAAWLRAARLAPRSPAIRRALAMVGPGDGASSRGVWVSPLTPTELALLGFVAWIGGWAVIFRRRGRVGTLAILLLVGAAGSAFAGLAVGRHYTRPLAIVGERGSLRVSPHGLAPEVAPLDAGTAVEPVRSDRGWTLVRGPAGKAGWLPAEALIPVSPDRRATFPGP